MKAEAEVHPGGKGRKIKKIIIGEYDLSAAIFMFFFLFLKGKKKEEKK